jgi:hypothetical protein
MVSLGNDWSKPKMNKSKYILETVIYYCDPDDIEIISSEFACEVDSHYYSMKEKFEKVSELLKE